MVNQWSQEHYYETDKIYLKKNLRIAGVFHCQ